MVPAFAVSDEDTSRLRHMPSGDERASGNLAPARRSAATRFVLLIGVVSLFSDMAHEGARGITGPFLGELGASAAVVAGVAGFGELLGYALRFVFGWLADRSRSYWPITLAGFGVQMAAVPALALAGAWPVAAALMAIERSGRAMRVPARDAMLAHAAGELGRGRVFGVREALDATGAMIGPLLVAAVVAARGDLRAGFAVLLIPALATMVVLIFARRQYPRPADLEPVEAVPSRRGIAPVFWMYLIGMGLIGFAYTDYPLMAFHFARNGVVGLTWIPVLYAGAMAGEAVASLGVGWAFDRFGMVTVVVTTTVTAVFAPMVFLGNTATAVIGVAVWGIGMAAQESIVKAALTGMVAPGRRASAFGLFDTGFGVFWFAGSMIQGVLYDHSVAALVVVSVVVQLLAVPVLAGVWRRERSRPK